MNSEEAYQSASELLEQRGQVLNGHLLRLVEGDKQLFREVRERLIDDGIAEDRSGVGLAITDFAKASRDPQTRVQSPATNWWLMKSGVVRGPLDLEQMCQMCRKGDIEAADVVRNGDRGPWKPVDSVPELAAARRGIQSQSVEFQRHLHVTSGLAAEAREKLVNATMSTGNVAPSPMILPDAFTGGKNGRDEKRGGSESGAAKEQFVFPEKNWSLGRQGHSNLIGRAWHHTAALVGGSFQLLLIVVGLSCGGMFYYWWQLPPSNLEISREFTACRNAMQKLRDKKSGRDEWSLMEDQYRSRIQGIATRLKPYANDKHPVQQALYFAATLGLLPMMEYSIESSNAEHFYNKHMNIAQKDLKP